MAAGFSSALNIYFNTFFWGFSTFQIGIVSFVAVVPGIICSMVIARVLSKNIGKKKAAIICGSIALALTPVPYALRIFELAPSFGSNGLLLMMVQIKICFTKHIMHLILTMECHRQSAFIIKRTTQQDLKMKQ